VFRLHEFLRRRARLQRVDEAVRRNVVIGFFDTVYWGRRFRNHMNSKHAGRMTDIPQFTVPEIFVDDEAAQDYRPSQMDGRYDRGFGPPSIGSSAPSSPRHGAMTPLSESELGGSSIQPTPTGSPTRSRGPFHDRSGSDVSENWHMAAAISRPVSPLGVENAEASARSRAGSSVSAQDVLDVLDNSAWGESIRKSFSTRRPSGEGRRGGPS
jgi:hypothetical protein